jgi:hypothetical protein
MQGGKTCWTKRERKTHALTSSPARAFGPVTIQAFFWMVSSRFAPRNDEIPDTLDCTPLRVFFKGTW